MYVLSVKFIHKAPVWLPSRKVYLTMFPGRSILFTEKLLETKSRQAEVEVIYMDFKKAFDSVFNNGLLMKLKSVGITRKLWLRLQTYLKYHFQCVRIGNSISEYRDILSGVSQGSVLGPLLLSYSLLIFL